MASVLGLRSTLCKKVRPRSSMFRLLLAALVVLVTQSRYVEHRRHDRRIACTSAQMAGQHLSYLRLRRVRYPLEIVRVRHQNARRAKAALQRMMTLERPLQITQRLVRRETFNRVHPTSFHLYGKHQARASRHAVHMYRACTAHAVFTPHVRSGRAEFMTHEIGQQVTRFTIARALPSVERHDDAPALASRKRGR